MKHQIVEEGIAFVDGHVEQVVDFDYDAIDRGNPLRAELEKSEEHFASLGDALAELLDFIWRDPRGYRREMQTVMRYFTALSAIINPSLLDDATYSQLGSELGCTRACISKLALQISDKWGLHFRRSKRAGMRANASKAQKLKAQQRKGLDTPKP